VGGGVEIQHSDAISGIELPTDLSFDAFSGDDDKEEANLFSGVQSRML
jgi:hypothetical protein